MRAFRFEIADSLQEYNSTTITSFALLLSGFYIFLDHVVDYCK